MLDGFQKNIESQESADKSIEAVEAVESPEEMHAIAVVDAPSSSI